MPWGWARITKYSDDACTKASSQMAFILATSAKVNYTCIPSTSCTSRTVVECFYRKDWQLSLEFDKYLNITSDTKCATRVGLYGVYNGESPSCDQFAQCCPKTATNGTTTSYLATACSGDAWNYFTCTGSDCSRSTCTKKTTTGCTKFPIVDSVGITFNYTYYNPCTVPGSWPAGWTRVTRYTDEECEKPFEQLVYRLPAGYHCVESSCTGATTTECFSGKAHLKLTIDVDIEYDYFNDTKCNNKSGVYGMVRSAYPDYCDSREECCPNSNNYTTMSCDGWVWLSRTCADAACGEKTCIAEKAAKRVPPCYASTVYDNRVGEFKWSYLHKCDGAGATTVTVLAVAVFAALAALL
eukprot:TRINITY_DN16958_c0_g1_i1.p2 TRINITY_DN16958_c0_g1~~TRINITY_DN16958_c0_g1_i1.p2  ORF type:complete len:410 (-),score=110.85 TRINITY_DN16958_c0_g1_i1:246-1307(-)